MTSNLIWHVEAWEDYLYWQKNDKAILKRINALIKTIIKTPYSGAGKPKPLKHALEGYWSRRISLEHRLVYKVTESGVSIVQCRYHY